MKIKVIVQQDGNFDWRIVKEISKVELQDSKDPKDLFMFYMDSIRDDFVDKIFPNN